MGGSGEDGGPLCRFCLEGEGQGQLVSPCDCSGGQRFVHLDCLRRWQRRVLIMQSTHPDDRRGDVRHRRCAVCLAELSVPPPSRLELMRSFTGPELAAQVGPGTIIGASQAFTEALAAEEGSAGSGSDSEGDGPSGCPGSNSRHWMAGAFLITSVEEDDGEGSGRPGGERVRLPIRDQARLDWLRGRLSGDLCFRLKGREVRLVAAGSLAGVPAEELAGAVAGLTAPCELVAAPRQAARACGEDLVEAVNLTRALRQPPCPEDVQLALEEAGHPAGVEVTHLNGGPCRSLRLSVCLVPSGLGWTPCRRLTDAVALAAARARTVHLGISEGQVVQLLPDGPQRHPCGSSEPTGRGTPRDTASTDPAGGGGSAASAAQMPTLGVAMAFDQDRGLWMVRAGDGQKLQLAGDRLQPLEGQTAVRVMAFWGRARWSRAQLLGEIAAGSWGLCSAAAGEVVVAPPSRRRGLLDGRLVFAPVTEMSEGYARQAQQEMDAYLAHSEQYPQLLDDQ